MTYLVTIVTLIAMSAAAVVFWASFCRLSKSSVRVRTSVRLGVWLLASSAFVAFWLPVFGWWTPDPVTAAILVAVAVHQTATSVTWRHGAPVMYMRGLR